MNAFGYFMATVLMAIGGYVIKISFDERGGSSLFFTMLGLALIIVAVLLFVIIRIHAQRQKYHVLHSGHSVL